MRITPKEWSKHLVAGLIRCAVHRWSVPNGADYAVGVFDCESGLYPFAIGGDNLGVTQEKARYWLTRANANLKSRWFNESQWKRVHQEASVSHPGPAFVARANVIVGVRMAHKYGWGPWSCAR